MEAEGLLEQDSERQLDGEPAERAGANISEINISRGYLNLSLLVLFVIKLGGGGECR